MTQFVNVRTMHKTDPQGMISLCHRFAAVWLRGIMLVVCYFALTARRLLATPDIEAAVRVGDVYALLTEWHFSQREFELALKMVQGMQKRFQVLYFSMTCRTFVWQTANLRAGESTSDPTSTHPWLPRYTRPTAFRRVLFVCNFACIV